MENPIKMDDLGIPIFVETPIYHPNLRNVLDHTLSKSPGLKT